MHDAAIDEYMGSVLLLTMQDVELKGIVIVKADCIAGPAMHGAWKIQCYLDMQATPLGLSSARA